MLFAISPLFSTILVALCLVTAFAEPLCDEKWQVKIAASTATVLQNGSLKATGGLLYPDNAFWKLNDTQYVGCPCNFKKCLQHCSRNTNSETMRKDILLWNRFHQHDFMTSAADINQEHLNVSLENNDSALLNELFYIVEEPRKDDDVIYLEVYPEIIDHFPLELLENTSFEQVCFIKENMVVKLYEISKLPDKTRNYVLAGCMFVSVICLALLLASFFISGEMKHLHGKCIACQSFSMMISFIGIAVSHLDILEVGQEEFTCYANGFLTYFFTMSSFFWLNTICFDMFWTFWYSSTGPKGEETSRFRLYMIYACATPSVLTLVVVYASFISEESKWFTGIGTHACFIVNLHMGEEELKSLGQTAYIYAPLLLLLLLNLVFFGMTLLKICQTQYELKRVLRIGTTSRNDKHQKFLMYVKLFAVMGGFWIMEFVSFIMQDNSGIWFAFDILNSLRGFWLLIFCVILSKRVRTKVLRKVLRFHGIKRASNYSGSTRNTTTVSSSKVQSAHIEMKSFLDE